jgi:glucose-1-phosphate adenylyltransferase
VDGRVERSVLSPGVYVSPGAVVRDSVILTDSYIGPGARVDRAIVDKEVRIGEGARVGDGDDNTPNRDMPDLLNTGISLVGKGAEIPPGAVLGRNCVVHPNVKMRENDKVLASGSTV